MTGLKHAGGFLDYRPGVRGVVNDVQTSAIFIEFANHISLNTVEVVWGKPARPEWSQALEITPRTVHALHVTVRLLLYCIASECRHCTAREHGTILAAQSLAAHSQATTLLAEICGSCSEMTSRLVKSFVYA